MSDTITEDLVRDVEQLLCPGEIALAGLVVQTEIPSGEDTTLHQTTLEIGELIAEHAGVTEWYVYSGNDSSEFGLNQHQGLRITDDGFVWECQQLLREGTYDVVMYYEATLDQEALVEAVEEAGYAVTSVPCPQ